MSRQGEILKPVSRWPFFTASICAMALGAFFMILQAREAEEVLTRTTLYQVKMLVESLDQERILRLTATEEDEQSPYYHELRNTLIRMRDANPTYRYLYLMGQRGSGPPFFYMGTAPTGTDEYSPPGQPYTEEAPALAHVFATGEATVSDMVTDRWGTWISALAPLHDRKTGSLLAVFGMDVDARDWLWSIRLRALLPGVLAIVLIIMLLLLYLALSSRQRIEMQHLLLKNNNVLRESERKTRAILDQSHQFIGMMTTDGILIDVNRTALEFIGVKETDVLNNPFWETPWWSHSTELQERLRAATTKAASGEFVGFEATNFTSDGGLRTVDFSLGPVRDETGKVLFIIPQGQDITERKRTEETLKASEERLSLALDAANDGLWDWDVVSGAAFFSPRYYTMLGYEPGGFEASYAEWRNRVHPDDMVRVEAHLSRYLEGLEPTFEVEFRFRCKGGGWRWILARGKAVGWRQEGQVARMVGTHVDITERKRLELRLADQLAFQQALMDTIPYAVFYKDAETRFMGCNTAYEGAFGIERKEFIGKRVLDLDYLPAQDRLHYQAEDEATIASVGRVSKEMFIPFADGLVHHTLYSVNGFSQADGSPGGLIGVIVDISDLKRAELALRESEARYRSVLENIQDMYYRTDTKGRLVLLSPSTPRQLGYNSVDELLGRPASDFWMQPELRHELLLRIKAQGAVKDYEVLLKTGDGMPLLVSTTSAYYRDAEGNVLGVEGIFRDITERKRAQEALQLHRSYLDTILENQPGLVWLKDEQGRFLATNRAFAVACGLNDPGSLHGKDDLHIWPRDLAEKYMADDQAVMQEGKPRIVEELISDQGEQRWFETFKSPVRNNQGVIVGTTGYARDITERKRAVEALRISKERLDALATMNSMTNADDRELTHFAMEAAVSLTGSAIGYIAFMNEDETVLTMYAWSRQAMRECAIMDKPIVYPVASTGLWGEAVRQRKAVITNDYAATNTYKKGMPGGHVNVTRHLNAPTFDGGQIVIVAGVGNKSTDYSDDDVRQLSLLMSGLWTIICRKRAEEALKQSRDELEQRVADRTRELTEANAKLTELDSLKSAFLNTVSHDLRTPLTSILGFSKIIQRDFTRRFLPLAEDDKTLCDKAIKILDNLGVIVSEGERLTRLVSDFLDLSRIEEGRYAWKDKVTDMGAIIGNTVSLLKGALLQKPGVQVRMDIAQDLPELWVDPDRIAQVLTNLLSNAIKFTSEGTVTLKATATPERIRLSVADTGIGIPPDDLPNVFDKFYQVAEDTLLAEKGTGLGLAISKQIVEHYDGTIWAESTVGVGSVFSFELPLSPSTGEQLAGPTKRHDRPLHDRGP